MRKYRNRKGFTLAELLIVVAIIGVLSGVAFIAVSNHEKSMTQMERDSIAKEIFIAAQNHLTVAKTQNYNLAGEVDYDGNTDFFGPVCTSPQGEADESGETEQQEGEVSPVHYLLSNSGDGFTGETPSALAQMLPFGSIDDKVRVGGNYMILYQPKAGVVLEVFYWESDGKYGGSMTYDQLMAADATGKPRLRGDDNRKNRLDNRPIIGWFGGTDVVDTGEFLNAPSISVVNGDRLTVEVTDTNIRDAGKSALNPNLKLIVEGNTSGARASFLLTHMDATTKGAIIPSEDPKTRLRLHNEDSTQVTYTIVLDDITADGMHFADLKKGMDEKYAGNTTIAFDGDTAFIPGEDITLYAVAYSNDALASIAYSGEWTTNSLFAAIEAQTDGDDPKNIALIGNIRHLENLDDHISNLGNQTPATIGDLFAGAEQTVDLNWDDFKEGIGGTVHVYTYYDGKATKDNCFMPVSPSYVLSYDGQSKLVTEITSNGVTTTKTQAANHSITGIVVDNTNADTAAPGGSDANMAQITAGGLFGVLTGGTVKNLELKDFSISLASGNAGALAGQLAGGSVVNVITYNGDNSPDVNISTAKGDAGGLIGSIGAEANVERSAAALIVESKEGNAGGLVGSASSTADAPCTVSGCYSGGHTEAGKYTGTLTGDVKNYNVTATKGTAGGLIGVAESTNIKNSYSTCSATGLYAGGFAGTAAGKITDCYATGLVRGTASDTVAVDGAEKMIPTDGAFAYSAMVANISGCKYFEIINEREDAAGGYACLGALGKNASPVADGKTEAAIEPFDATAESYSAFIPAEWAKAIVYDSALETYYKVTKEVTVKDEDGKETTTTAENTGYPLKTVKQLGEDGVQEEAADATAGEITTPADYVLCHYGDWPAPETFVVNEPVKQLKTIE